MQLNLKKQEAKRGMLGGKTVYTLVASLTLTEAEKATIFQFNLQSTLLYSAEQGSENFKQYMSTGGTKVELFARLLARKKISKITGLDLMAGLTFEDEYVLSIIELEGRVIEAANTFDAAVKAASLFLGEKSLDLPVV